MSAADIRVFRPRSLGGLLRLYARNPEALLYAGGTEIVPGSRRGPGLVLDLPEKVIFLGAVPELTRISRSQRFLDIGACLTVSRILSIGRNVLPPVLFQALSGIGTPPIRNLVTLGGNVCASASGGDARSALSVIDAQFEVRSAAGARWMGSGQLLARAAVAAASPGEILCRVRVPLEEWSGQYFRKVPLSGPGHSSLCFAGVADFPKGSIEALHFCITAPGVSPFRSRALESRLKGARLPLPAREVEALAGELLTELQGGRASDRGPGYVGATAVRLLRAFLLWINERGLEGR
jgi:CO/xanthine dehydrogenase FAD-binding subunit